MCYIIISTASWYTTLLQLSNGMPRSSQIRLQTKEAGLCQNLVSPTVGVSYTINTLVTSLIDVLLQPNSPHSACVTRIHQPLLSGDKQISAFPINTDITSSHQHSTISPHCLYCTHPWFSHFPRCSNSNQVSEDSAIKNRSSPQLCLDFLQNEH